MVLCTILQVYAAVRVIRAHGACASGLVACAGVLPGCQETANMAKLTAKSIIGMCNETRLIAIICAYVDDFNMRMDGH